MVSFLTRYRIFSHLNYYYVSLHSAYKNLMPQYILLVVKVRKAYPMEGLHNEEEVKRVPGLLLL